jgi:intracellular septation protein A
MKSSLSVLWRVMVLQIVFVLITILLLKSTPLMTDVNLIQWKAPFIYFSFGLVLFLFQTMGNRSLVKLIYGANLNLSDAIWRRLTYCVIAYCAVVACADVVVARFASFDTWNQFKTLAPIITLIGLAISIPLVLRNTRT